MVFFTRTHRLTVNLHAKRVKSQFLLFIALNIGLQGQTWQEDLCITIFSTTFIQYIISIKLAKNLLNLFAFYVYHRY